MATFNTKDNRKVTKASGGVIQTSPIPSGTTAKGGVAYARDARSDLFLQAVGSMFGQKKYHAQAEIESARFVKLVREVAQADPAWTLEFITWLRNSGNMRTSAVVASIEAADVARQDGQPGHEAGMARQLAQAGISRTDEIGEALAYWVSSRGNKRFPKPIKRGLADACIKLVSEYSAAKYNPAGKSWTLGQALNVLHPATGDLKQRDLFGYLVAKEYGEVEIPESLTMLRNRAFLMGIEVSRRREFLDSQTFKAAGMTWEAMAGWLQGTMDAKAWEAIIPSMGYMAQLRNLRNFETAGISRQMSDLVCARLSDAAQVARSKQFPFRFLSAYRQVSSLRWGPVLSDALDRSLDNIPTMAGRTLILVDTSGSMGGSFSEYSEMKLWDAAALFGIAMAHRNPGRVDLVSYSNHGKVFEVKRGADVLGELARWGREGYNIGHGTDTFGVLHASYRNHDRVIILTDEQADPSFHTIDNTVRADAHTFTFNLAGYAQAHASTSAYRHSFGGLTDACFPLISQVEAGATGQWPWETDAQGA